MGKRGFVRSLLGDTVECVGLFNPAMAAGCNLAFCPRCKPRIDAEQARIRAEEDAMRNSPYVDVVRRDRPGPNTIAGCALSLYDEHGGVDGALDHIRDFEDDGFWGAVRLNLRRFRHSYRDVMLGAGEVKGEGDAQELVEIEHDARRVERARVLRLIDAMLESGCRGKSVSVVLNQLRDEVDCAE